MRKWQANFEKFEKERQTWKFNFLLNRDIEPSVQFPVLLELHFKKDDTFPGNPFFKLSVSEFLSHASLIFRQHYFLTTINGIVL